MKVCSVEGCDRPSRRHLMCEKHSSRVARHGSIDGGGTKIGEPLQYLTDLVAGHTDDVACVIWPYGRYGTGYPSIYVEGKRELAHRLACKMHRGEPASSNLQAAHSCGNGQRGCVNPHHLSWKTQAQNEADKLIHGTHNRGEKNPSAKLIRADAERIRARFASGEANQPQLARAYRVSEATISQIVLRKTWA